MADSNKDDKMAEKSSDSKDLQDLLSDALEELKCNDKETRPSKPNVAAENVSFEETLKMMHESLSNQQTSNSIPEEKELEEMFQEFATSFGSMEGAGQECNNFLPIMESMMKSILSKDLLYPPLQDLCSKYPDWLADNRANLSEKDFDQYNQQYLVAKEIVQIFECQDESQNSGSNQFDKVFELMQKMQTFGHPPKELIGDSPELLDPSNPMKNCNVQ